MTKDDVIAEIDRRMTELRKAKKTIAIGERIDELRVFKKWVEQQ